MCRAFRPARSTISGRFELPTDPQSQTRVSNPGPQTNSCVSSKSRGLLAIQPIPPGAPAGDLRGLVMHCPARLSGSCNGRPANLLKLQSFTYAGRLGRVRGWSLPSRAGVLWDSPCSALRNSTNSGRLPSRSHTLSAASISRDKSAAE